MSVRIVSEWNAKSHGTFSLSSIEVDARAPRIEYIHIVGHGQARHTNLLAFMSLRQLCLTGKVSMIAIYRLHNAFAAVFGQNAACMECGNECS
jgi:hypothetical protein